MNRVISPEQNIGSGPTPDAPTQGEIPDAVRGPSRLREYILVPALLLLLVLGAIVHEAFLTPGNIGNILGASAALALVVLAEALILISGKFDLSLESTVAAAPAIGAMVLIPAAVGGWGLDWPVWAGLLIMVGVGLGIGLFNGFLIVRLGLNAFIVTLSMLIVLRGVHQGFTNSRTLYEIPPVVFSLATVRLLGLPLSVWVAGAAFLVAGLILHYHRIGRAIYAIGGNAEAARLSGIKVDRIRMGIYVVAGGIATVAGIILVGYVGSVPPNLGSGMIFTVFAAAVVGGVSLDGGRGTMFGALTGVLLLAVVQNILVLGQVPTYWIQAAYGAIILMALIASRLTGGEAQN